MFCKNCGKEMRDDARFCPNCGAVNGGPVRSRPTRAGRAGALQPVGPGRLPRPRALPSVAAWVW